MTGDVFTVRSAIASTFSGQETAVLSMVDQNPVDIVDSAGAVIEKVPAKNATLSIKLSYTDQWRLSMLQIAQ